MAEASAAGRIDVVNVSALGRKRPSRLSAINASGRHAYDSLPLVADDGEGHDRYADDHGGRPDLIAAGAEKRGSEPKAKPPDHPPRGRWRALRVSRVRQVIPIQPEGPFRAKRDHVRREPVEGGTFAWGYLWRYRK